VVFSPSLGLIAGIVLLSVVLGAIDIFRQPNWAWRAAGEPKLVCLLLVLLLPGVGLAIYVFATRPKLVEVAAAGRAANLPFERFGDQPDLATRRGRQMQVLAMPTVFGSFGERRQVRTIKASGPDIGPSGSGSFFDDPDLVTVGAPAATAEPAPVVTETIEQEIRFPGSLGRPYNPTQRTSLEGEHSLASVAAQIFGATDETEPVRSVRPAPAPARSYGAPAMATPRTVPGSPDHTRPWAREVDQILASSQTATATMNEAAPTLGAQWLRDPTNRHHYRYWDGRSWTGSVSDAGVESQDPITA
jgi:hypothetical protein